MNGIIEHRASSAQRTPYGCSPAARSLERQTREAYLQRRMDDLSRAWAEMEALFELIQGWDGDDAHPISSTAIARAQAILFSTANEPGISWQAPEIAPNPDGGVDLWWDLGGRQLLLILDAHSAHTVCVTRDGLSEPGRGLLSNTEVLVNVFRASGG